MSQTAFKILINIPVILITFMLGFYLPELSPKDILFEIKISPEERQHKAYAKIIQEYKRLYSIICGSFSVLLIAAFSFNGTYFLLLTGLIILIVLMEIVQYLIYKKAKQLNVYRSLSKIDSNYLIIDDRPQITQNLPSSWFLVPGLIVTLSTIAGTAVYQIVPNFLPSGLFITGNDSHFIKKSIFLIILPFILQITALAAAYISFIKISKFTLSEDKVNMEILEKRTMVFKLLWSLFILTVCTLIEIYFFLTEFRLMAFIGSKTYTTLTLVLLFAAALTLIFTVKLTRSSNYHQIIIDIINSRKNTASSLLIDRTDDAYWILGSFYFNPKDPSSWITKRSGRGINFNFGRPITWLIFSVPITSVIIVLIYLFINKI